MLLPVYGEGENIEEEEKKSGKISSKEIIGDGEKAS